MGQAANIRRGWGVLVLPMKDFRVESTPHKSLNSNLHHPYGIQDRLPWLFISAYKSETSSESDDIDMQETPDPEETSDNADSGRYESIPKRPKDTKTTEHVSEDTIEAFSPNKVSLQAGMAIFRTHQFAADLITYTKGLPNTYCSCDIRGRSRPVSNSKCFFIRPWSFRDMC